MASPAKIIRDLFCAFHPKRVTDPSLPLVLSIPPIPSWLFCDALAARFACSVVSGVFSTSPSPKQRRWNAENHVVIRELGREIGLRETAARRIRPSRDRKQAMYAAVWSRRRLIPGGNESRLADGTVRGNERWNRVVGAVERRQRHLRIRHGMLLACQARAAAADSRLGVALSHSYFH